jgi:hypothetical protein
MVRVLPPPEERFDPVTARWLTPGGPLHDPQRDSLDPEHAQPMRLIDPIPCELAESESLTGSVDKDALRAAWRRRWLVIGFAALVLAAMFIGGVLVG